ncbi:MAG: hypothetical protein H7Z39_04245 [Burkholderiaceae bacterium]|nr:hypothetical protein [Burkholderiaceae bacterium]
MTTTEQTTQADAPATSSWAHRVKEALEAGQPPSYDDIEEGLADVMQLTEEIKQSNLELRQQNAVLMDFSREAQELITQMVTARHFGDPEKVLSILDDFMKKRVVIKDETQAAH